MAKWNYRVIKSDIRNKKNILKAIKKSTDIVLLAGLVGDPITKKYPIISKKINEAAIIDIIKICKNCELDKVIFVSTCSNYGLLKSNKLADEKTKLSPLSSQETVTWLDKSYFSDHLYQKIHFSDVHK